MKKIVIRIALVLALLLAGAVGYSVYIYKTYLNGGKQVFGTVPPRLPATMRQPAILIFTATNGFRDPDGINAATSALTGIARARGWGIYVTDNSAVFNDLQLARFAAVVWNNTSGNVLLPPQRAAFRRYIENGGGFVGIHGAGGDTSYDWRWYGDTLLGAQFTGHTLIPEFQRAIVRIEDRTDPATRGLPAIWPRTDEWYSFSASPRGKVHVLATVDENSYTPRMAWKSIRMGKDHPIVWKHCVGKGRAFYSALGHTPESYSEPYHVRLLEGAIAWAAGLEPGPCPAP